MRTPAHGLALCLLVACGGSPGEVTTDLSTTEAPPTSGSPTTSNPDDTTAGPGTMTSADTGEEVCPPMPPEDGGYDPCPGLCGGGGQCFNDAVEGYAVCTRGCFMDCNCWPAPEGDGDARARCSSALLETTSVCVLDCSGGESCPRGMFCVPDLGICAHPYPGTETGTGSSSSDGGTTDMGTSSSDGGTTDMGTSSSDGSTTDMGTSSGGSTTDMGTSSGGSTTDMGSSTTDMGSSSGGTTSGSTTGGT